jgi:aminoglycoside phosphotransferase (APT) family kinase protein
MMDLSRLTQQLERFFAQHLEAPVRIGGVSPMEDGHAGLTFGFDLEAASQAGGYVIRLAPAGVKRRGNTDVYRQAPLLRALHANGLPVPSVPWAADDEDWFDVPYVITERLPGRTLIIWEPHPTLDQGQAFLESLWCQSAEALAPFHRLDWQHVLGDWEAPVALGDEIAKWDRILAQAPEAEWLALGEEVRSLLGRYRAPESPIGLFHGDYQPGNVLFDDGQMVGVLDWELAGIGAQLIDMGWLLMFGDPQSWHESWMPQSPASDEAMIAIYEGEMGQRFDQIRWYQAFAGYRFAVISCLNVKLHRRGQRHDPVWERFACAIPNMFIRARSLLEQFHA